MCARLFRASRTREWWQQGSRRDPRRATLQYYAETTLRDPRGARHLELHRLHCEFYFFYDNVTSCVQARRRALATEQGTRGDQSLGSLYSGGRNGANEGHERSRD